MFWAAPEQAPAQKPLLEPDELITSTWGAISESTTQMHAMRGTIPKKIGAGLSRVKNKD